MKIVLFETEKYQVHSVSMYDIFMIAGEWSWVRNDDDAGNQKISDLLERASNNNSNSSSSSSSTCKSTTTSEQ